MVIKPGGEVEAVTKSFVANVVGVYHVYYYVADEAGNVTLASYQVTVE